MLICSGFEINKLLSNKFVQLGCFKRKIQANKNA